MKMKQGSWLLGSIDHNPNTPICNLDTAAQSHPINALSASSHRASQELSWISPQFHSFNDSQFVLLTVKDVQDETECVKNCALAFLAILAIELRSVDHLFICSLISSSQFTYDKICLGQSQEAKLSKWHPPRSLHPCYSLSQLCYC